MNKKFIVELIESEDYTYVYNVLFHPSPILYVGDKALSKGGAGPYEIGGLFSNLSVLKKITRVVVYTDFIGEALEAILLELHKDCNYIPVKVISI